MANAVEFVDFIKRKENAYEEGDENVHPNMLMLDSLVKFKARKLINKWSAPTKEQGQILALTAQIEKLRCDASPVIRDSLGSWRAESSPHPSRF
jgi:hypothetical protein